MEDIIDNLCISSEMSQRRIDNQRAREWQKARANHHRLATRNDCKSECYSPVENFHLRFDEILGPPKKLLFEAMMKDHCSSTDSKLVFILSHNGFESIRNLNGTHVAAFCLYTTSAFRYINTPLRESSGMNDVDDDSFSRPRPYPITLSFIDEGIKILRGVTSKRFENDITTPTLKKPWFLYRGIKNTRIDEEFLERRRGGTELGLMSTTKI